MFEQEEDPTTRSFFSEIISSISDVRFSQDGRYILSRDYLTVKIWDVNMERQPVKTIPIHEHLRPRLCDTYENDSIFDKFEVVFSGDGKNVMTGSYNNNFMIYPSEPEQETEIVLQADKSAFKAKKIGVPTPINASSSPNGKKGGSRANSPAGQRMRKETDADQIDFNKKILHMSWHPFEDSIAIAATNNVSLPISALRPRANDVVLDHSNCGDFVAVCILGAVRFELMVGDQHGSSSWRADWVNSGQCPISSSWSLACLDWDNMQNTAHNSSTPVSQSRLSTSI